MLLVDTNVVLWLASDARLSRLAEEAIANLQAQGSGLAVSTTTLWEIAFLGVRGKLSFSPSVDIFLQRVERAYHVLPMTREIALAGARFSSAYPKDPADRQIGATALVHGVPFVTADRAIRASGEVSCIW